MFTLNDLPIEERPRERFARGETVGAQELIAIILGRGGRGLPVMHIAQNLLAKFKSLPGIVGASVQELQDIPGLGPVKALQLKACLEISRRIVQEEALVEQRKNNSQAVSEPQDIGRLIRPLIRNWNKEHLYVVSFDNRNRILGVDLIAIGTLNTNVMHPRETFDAAISRHAASFAISHNHPSGDPQPSEADLIVTERLKQAAEIMGIQLLDHVIIAKTHLFSFKENGLLS